MQEALKLSLQPFACLVKTLKNNYKEIVKSMQTGITNAAAEGTKQYCPNGKIKSQGLQEYGQF